MGEPASDRRPAARAVTGLVLLGVLALGVALSAPLLRTLREPPPRPDVYREPETGQLLWSPEGSRPPRAAAPEGWEGLLLGTALVLTATRREDLEALPGAGPRTAAAILDTRSRLGGFSSVDELRRVPGVGPKTMERLRPLLRVAPPASTPQR